MSGGTPLGTALAQIQLEPIRRRRTGRPRRASRWSCRTQLDFELTGGGGLISPTHRLKVRMTTNRKSIITDVTTGRVMAEITGIDASFHADRARDRQDRDERPHLRARVVRLSRASSSASRALRARLDAEDRAAKVIAENIRTRLASFFVAGT